MCTLILIHQMIPDLPVVLASNRDEWLVRPSSPPSFLDERLGIVGGRDQQAQGTWLGVCQSGFFAGVTNQRQSAPADPALKSRGALVMEVLKAGAEGGVDQARAVLSQTNFNAYNPFHIAFGTPEEMWVTKADQPGQTQQVPPGIHVLTNDGLNAETFPKVRTIQESLSPLPPEWPELRARLMELLSDDTAPLDVPEEPHFKFPREVRAALHAIRVNLPQYGTCSSSLIGIGPGGLKTYEFADGPPGEVPFVPQSALITTGMNP